MRKCVLTLLFILTINSLFAQKITRAINALNENKVDKAIELFQELIEKNKLDIAAIIGLAQARDINNPTRNNKSELIETIDLLISARLVYDYYDATDKKYFALMLKTNSSQDINDLIFKLVEDLWFKHVFTTNSIEETENFINKYKKFNKINTLVENKLVELNFTKASELNTVSEYQIFLYRFPNTKYNKIIDINIDNLYFKKAIENNSITDLETFIKMYPNSNNINKASEELSILYINSINNSKNPDLLKSVLLKNKELKQSYVVEKNSSIIETILSNFYISTIDENTNLTNLQQLKFLLTNLKHADSIITKLNLIENKIYKIEYTNINNSTNYQEINNFLIKYNNYPQNHLPIYDRRDSLWFITLEPYSFDKINEYSNFFKIATFNKSYSGLLEKIRIDVMNEIKNKIYKLVDNFILEEDEELSNIENFRALLKDNNFFKIFIDQDYVLKNLINKDVDLLSDQNLSILTNENKIIANPIYYEHNNNGNTFTTYVNVNGIINKSSYYIKNKNLIASPIFSTNFDMFNIIKTRYGIQKFSNMNLEEFNATTNDCQVSLYGFTLMNLKTGTCCPSYKIDMLFSKQGNGYIPKTAISINNFNSTIDNNINLNNLKKIDVTDIIKNLNNED